MQNRINLERSSKNKDPQRLNLNKKIITSHTLHINFIALIERDNELIRIFKKMTGLPMIRR